MRIQQLVSVCLELRVKIVKGSPIPPISNTPETLPRENDDPLPQITHSMNHQFSMASTLLFQKQRRRRRLKFIGCWFSSVRLYSNRSTGLGEACNLWHK